MFPGYFFVLFVCCLFFFSLMEVVFDIKLSCVLWSRKKEKKCSLTWIHTWGARWVAQDDIWAWYLLYIGSLQVEAQSKRVQWRNSDQEIAEDWRNNILLCPAWLVGKIKSLVYFQNGNFVILHFSSRGLHKREPLGVSVKKAVTEKPCPLALLMAGEKKWGVNLFLIFFLLLRKGNPFFFQTC